MKKIPVLIIIIAAAWFNSCGIEEFFFLPQVPQNFITTRLAAEATITIPPVNETEYYYFTNYAIYYKLYTGNDPYTDNLDFNTDLRGDTNAIFPYTDPTNTASSASIDNLFKTRNFNELLFEGESNNSIMPSSGGTLEIVFPDVYDKSPNASLNNTSKQEVPLCRSITEPIPNKYFFNSLDLRTDTRNTDVSKRGGSYVCASLYIVAVGYDNQLFKPIYSKPTHVGIFNLAFSTN